MKKVYFLLIALFVFSPFIVFANYKPSSIKSKEDLVYFIRYYNGFQVDVKKNSIKLNDDIVIKNIPIRFNLINDLVLDLNGHDIICKNNKPCIIVDGDNKLLSLINSSNNKSLIKSNVNAIIINNSKTKIENINVLSNSSKYDSLLINGGKVKIDNSEISSLRDSICLRNGFLKIGSGIFNGKRYGLNIDSGKAIIEGGTFKGYSSGLKLNNYQSFFLKNATFETLKHDLYSKRNYNELFVPVHFYKFETFKNTL